MQLHDVMIFTMLKKLRRWHFDLALLLGVAIFSWAYCYSKPRPAWTAYYSLKENDTRNYFLTILGYSADSQSIYTSCETTRMITRNWAIPQIQRWSTQTGELLEDIPLELPEQDRFLLQLGKLHSGYFFTITTLSSDLRYFAVRYQESNKKDHHYFRLYRLDGKPVGRGLEIPGSDRVEYLTDPSGGESHWVVQFHRNYKKDDPISVIDIDSGKLVRSPWIYGNDRLTAFPTVEAGRYIFFILKPTETTPMQMEVVDLQTGESLGLIQTTKLPRLLPLGNNCFVVLTTVRDSNTPSGRIDFYRYDPVTKSMNPDHSRPFDGLISDPSQYIWVEPPYLISVTRPRDRENESEFVKVILGWLSDMGLMRPTIPTATFSIADWTTGQPLRQITGFPEQGEYRTSPEWRSLIAPASDPKGQPGLCLYRIPHYFWERTLSWMQWLSWLFIIPWPLRYFVVSRNNSSIPSLNA